MDFKEEFGLGGGWLRGNFIGERFAIVSLAVAKLQRMTRVSRPNGVSSCFPNRLIRGISVVFLKLYLFVLSCIWQRSFPIAQLALWFSTKHEEPSSAKARGGLRFCQHRLSDRLAILHCV